MSIIADSLGRQVAKQANSSSTSDAYHSKEVKPFHPEWSIFESDRDGGGKGSLGPKYPKGE